MEERHEMEDLATSTVSLVVYKLYSTVAKVRRRKKRREKWR
jgi:hypothetical protein